MGAVVVWYVVEVGVPGDVLILAVGVGGASVDVSGRIVCLCAHAAA